MRSILIEWFVWHFIEAPKFLFLAWNNYISFGLDYFSVPLLLKTLFYPWRKYKWNYPKSFDLPEFFKTLISNVFSRILGLICRVVLIILGIIFISLILLLGALLILLWIFLPILIIFILLVILNF